MPTLDNHQSSDYTKPKRINGSLRERFKNYCGPKEEVTGCIPWLASKNKQGYGQIQVGDSITPTVMLAHRVAWQLAGKTLVNGQEILHLCNNPACVNIDHLEQGTHKRNMEMAGQDGLMKGPRKFTKADYDYIKRKVAQGFLKKDIAFDIGCSPALITKVINGSLKNADAR